VAAIGPATAAELEKSGLKKDGPKVIITGRAGFDSEALLEVLSRDRVAGKKIAIFRGKGGRELLGETLRSRDAEVEYIECYRRVRPDGDMHALLPRWRRGEIVATVATSAEIVANLFGMAGEPGLGCLRRTPMFVPHPRVAAAAFQYGAHDLMVTGGGDEALAAGIETWFGRVRPEHANFAS
jgi:uroporphyrinogen-III synthase